MERKFKIKGLKGCYAKSVGFHHVAALFKKVKNERVNIILLNLVSPFIAAFYFDMIINYVFM